MSQARPPKAEREKAERMVLTLLTKMAYATSTYEFNRLEAQMWEVALTEEPCCNPRLGPLPTLTVRIRPRAQ